MKIIIRKKTNKTHKTLLESVLIDGQIGGISFDQKSGFGTTGYNQSIDQTGVVVMITPDDFLKLVPSEGATSSASQKKILSIKDRILNGESVASPWLTISYEEETDSIQVIEHEGRHRVNAIKSINPKIKIPVILEYSSKGYDEETIESLIPKINLFIKSQTGQYIKLSQEINEYYHLGETKKINSSNLEGALLSQEEAIKDYLEKQNDEKIQFINEFVRKKQSWINTNKIDPDLEASISFESSAQGSSGVETDYQLKIFFYDLFSNYFGITNREQDMDEDVYEKYYNYYKKLGERENNKINQIINKYSKRNHIYITDKNSTEFNLESNGSFGVEINFKSETELFNSRGEKTNAEENLYELDDLKYSKLVFEVINFVFNLLKDNPPPKL
jgi:hypothetical protein